MDGAAGASPFSRLAGRLAGRQLVPRLSTSPCRTVAALLPFGYAAYLRLAHLARDGGDSHLGGAAEARPTVAGDPWPPPILGGVDKLGRWWRAWSCRWILGACARD